MKLHDRQGVPGTDPVIYIGHRPYAKPDGKMGVSKTWYAEYNLHGEAHYEALGEKNKAAAIREVFRILDRIERGESKPIIRKLEWTELRDKYLEFQINRNRGTLTMKKYRHGVESLLEFVQAREIPCPAKFRPEDFWKFNKHLIDLKKEPKTVFDRMMFIKQVFRWAAMKAKLLAENPLVNEFVEKPPPKEQPCFTPEQVTAILANASTDDKPVFAVMAYTGMRFGEVRDLRWSDLHLDRGAHGQIFVSRGGSGRTTKGKSNRVIPIGAKLREILDALPKSWETIFRDPTGSLDGEHVPLKERKLLARLKRTCKKCGFPSHKKYKLHTFRHAFASMCARENVSHMYALEWLGHKSSEILRLYYKMFDNVADAAMARITYEPKTEKAA